VAFGLAGAAAALLPQAGAAAVQATATPVVAPPGLSLLGNGAPDGAARPQTAPGLAAELLQQQATRAAAPGAPRSAPPATFAAAATFLWESPVSSASRAVRWIFEEPVQPRPAASISLLGSADARGGQQQSSGQRQQQGLPADRGSVDQRAPQPGSPLARIGAQGSTMFGGIPWLLLLPVVVGSSLVVSIQSVSLYCEWKDGDMRALGGKGKL